MDVADRVGLAEDRAGRCCRAPRGSRRRSARRDSPPRRARAPGSWCPWRRRAPGCARPRGGAASARSARHSRLPFITPTRLTFSATACCMRRMSVLGPQPEQMAHGVDQVGAVHGVEVEIGDAAVDQIEHLLGGDRGGDQLAGGGIVVETVEALGQPIRHRGAAARGEDSGLLEVLHRQDAGHDRARRCRARARDRDSGSRGRSRRRTG